MSGIKKADGAVSQHATNRQFERGPGVKNVPLKKSTTNPEPTMIAQNQPTPHKGKPVTRPNSPASDAGRVLLEQNQAGSHKTGSTFRAPRSSGSSDPLQTGYTKPGKM